MPDASPSCRRLLSLRLPHLPTDRLLRRRDGFSRSSAEGTAAASAEPPLAIVERIGSARRLSAVDGRAEARGLAAGLAAADARARVPELVLVERDPDGERDSLEAIADWCDRFTPLVGHDPAFPDEFGLLLDATGVAHLFGGEAAFAARLVADLAARGFAAVAAVAGTAAAARAIARRGLGRHTHRVIPPGGERDALVDLPVDALDADAGRVGDLARLGLTTIGALLALPRAALARRFGADLLDRLDEAVGRLERPISPRLPAPAFVVERAFAEPLVRREDLATTVRALAEGLAESLERHGRGLRIAELATWRVDGSVKRLRVGTARPLRDPDRLLALFAERLKAEADELDPGFGIDLVRLSALSAGPFDTPQADLAGDRGARADFDHLVDRLGARLGSRRVTRPVRIETHLPELASGEIPATAEGPEAAPPALGPAGPDEPPERPLRLLARPEPIDALAELPDGPPLRFRWRRAFHEVVRAEGPERIAPPWWRGPLPRAVEAPAPPPLDPSLDPEFGPVEPHLDPALATRDYFRLEDHDGRRFWVFRAGLFLRETLRPRWFLHGFFG